MIPLTRFKEKSFETLDQTLEELKTRKREDHFELGKALSISSDGTISGPKFESRLSKTGMNTLLDRLNIPYPYAYKTCPDDLLLDSINQLFKSSDQVFRVRTLSNIVTSVLSGKAEPIDHEFIIKYCLNNLSGKFNITLGEKMMRIRMETETPVEVFPDDRFKLSWEVVNSPDDFYPLQANRGLYRMICSNGSYGFKNFMGYRRKSSENINCALTKLRAGFGQDLGEDLLKAALVRANKEQLGNHFERIKKEMETKISKDSWDLHFKEMNPDSTWYDLFNEVTLKAQEYTGVEDIRKFEYLGGEILSLFLNPNDKKRWLSKRSTCDSCEFTNTINPGQVENN